MTEIDYKAVLEQIASLAKSPPSDPTQDDEDFNPDDYAGGNIDDAYYSGYETGTRVGTWDVVRIARDALGLKDDE
jgi:hypothetical protein